MELGFKQIQKCLDSRIGNHHDSSIPYFKDHLKAALQMEKSPSGLHVAVVDNQNRILVFDTALGTAVHVWKGYHHAQIGWVNATTVPVTVSCTR